MCTFRMQGDGGSFCSALLRHINTLLTNASLGAGFISHTQFQCI